MARPAGSPPPGPPCFACGRPLGREAARFRVDTRDAQTVFVGPDCFKAVRDAGEAGMQPPRGGPRLWLLPFGPVNHVGA